MTDAQVHEICGVIILLGIFWLMGRQMICGMIVFLGFFWFLARQM